MFQILLERGGCSEPKKRNVPSLFMLIHWAHAPFPDPDCIVVVLQISKTTKIQPAFRAYDLVALRDGERDDLILLFLLFLLLLLFILF